MFFKTLCAKIAGVDELQENIKDLQQQIDDRDTIIKRIKIVTTGNHYGYSEKDKQYREENLINVKLRKIFELACTFDKTDDYLWDSYDEGEE